MAITPIRCAVLGGEVAQVINLEDEVTALICREYDAASGVCRLKKGALDGGPLSQLLERVSEHTLMSRSTRCHLGPA